MKNSSFINARAISNLKHNSKPYLMEWKAIIAMQNETNWNHYKKREGGKRFFLGVV